MKITASAPGKIILMGEHSVVYGYPALLAAIDKRIAVTIENSSSKNPDSSIPPKLYSDISKIFFNTYKKRIESVKISLKSEIPIGKHLGSSAAFGIAIFAALMRYFLKIWDPQKINELAYQLEKKIHIHPSGVDNSASCFGGLVWFRRETDFLKSIWSLPIHSYKIPQFILIDTGRPDESTGEMVEFVRKRIKTRPRFMESIFNDQEKQTKRVLVNLKTGDFSDLRYALISGERNLEKMGVVSPSTKTIIKKIEHIGGAAKICGGGGKSGPTGVLLAYHQAPEKLMDLAKKIKLDAFFVKLGEEGVKIENGPN